MIKISIVILNKYDVYLFKKKFTHSSGPKLNDLTSLRPLPNPLGMVIPLTLYKHLIQHLFL